MKNSNRANEVNNFPTGILSKASLGNKFNDQTTGKNPPEILFITSYPPRECGIATFSQDLIKALNNKFDDSFTINICPLESNTEKHVYTEKIKYILNTDQPGSFIALANAINADNGIRMVLIQHEFGFFEKKGNEFRQFLNLLNKPVIIVFHTVLPNPDDQLKVKVQQLSNIASAIIVMTESSAGILVSDYQLSKEKINVIPHGTHLVPHLNKETLKIKYDLSGKKVLTTFGLLSSGKSIETTLNALPDILKTEPDVLFLIIGKTHPSVINREGEKYRKMLEAKVAELKLESYVKFINYFLPLEDLLDYLQLTDIYLFTSKDPNQAVSGTFSYAISCGCPVISTPIPHAREILQNDAGLIIDFENSRQLSEAVISLLKNEELRKNITLNGLHRMASTAWENAAIAYAKLFEKFSDGKMMLNYKMPDINLIHLKKMTTDFGMIQFSKLYQPDTDSGYTLDDNARALIAVCQHFEMTADEADIQYINTYFNFIKYCLQPDGYFQNYVNEKKEFTKQNSESNLSDAGGRAIWALGYLISINRLLPADLIREATSTFQSALLNINKIHSTRAMAFAIKGLYYRNSEIKSIRGVSLIRQLANRLVQMYRHESNSEWQWFESYLTYANSILPEAMLCAWMITGDPTYKYISKLSFDFLLSTTFNENRIKVISNKSWLYKGEDPVLITNGGEQPIDVAYTILALSKFYEEFKEEEYLQKMKISFNWFLGANHLNQVIYNPCTGGCYDGLEDNYINLNQGAESTISYLLARLSIEKTLKNKNQEILSEEFSTAVL